MPRDFHLAFYLFRVGTSPRLDPKRYVQTHEQRVKILQLAETWTRYTSLPRKNGIACRADDKLTFLVPGGNAPGLISRFGIEWTVSLSSLRTITILTPHWQFTLFISFHRHGTSCSISLEKYAAQAGDVLRSVRNIQHILLPSSFANRNGSLILDSLDNYENLGHVKLPERNWSNKCFITRFLKLYSFKLITVIISCIFHEKYRAISMFKFSIQEI